MVVRGNAGGGGVFIFVLQRDHRKLTTEEGDHYRAQSGGGGPHGFQGERRGLFVSVLQGDYRKLTTEEGNH